MRRRTSARALIWVSAVVLNLTLVMVATGTVARAAAPSIQGRSAAPVTICRGDLPFGSYINVVVPPNATCSASGSTVAQTLTVGRGASFFGGFVTIGGSLISVGAKYVRLTGFSVAGDVIVRGGGGDLTILTSTVRGVVDVSDVNGFIAVINNDSPGALGRLRVVNNTLKRLDPTSTVGLNVSSNQVRTNATVSANKGRVDKNVQGNTVGGTLSCVGNSPPFLGTFNTAQKFEGECTGPV
jgi:hypothetical protein